MEETRRPSTWAAALGVGLMAAALAVMADLAHLREWYYYAALGVAWTGGTLLLAHGAQSLLGFTLFVFEVIRDGQQTFRRSELPADEPAEPDSHVDYDAERAAWATALSRFFRAGDAAGGFSIRKLDGVIGSDAWARLTAFYSSEDGNRVLRVGPGDQGTVWGWGWNLDTVLQRIGTGHFPFPSGPVPDVELYVVNATQQRAKRRATTAKQTVEGTARAAD